MVGMWQDWSTVMGHWKGQ